MVRHGTIMGRRGVVFGSLSLLALAGCTGQLGSGIGGGTARPAVAEGSSGKTFGTGPVRVALLLPLSGNAELASVGQSMANAAELAMDRILANGEGADTITLEVRDTGPSAGGAASAASAAVAAGARLILGPLKADQVTAAGNAARSGGVPLIGFSNNSGAAQPGVYLLNVLPETEAHRSLGYAKASGRQAFAGIFPATDYGRIQQSAFTQAMADLGLSARGIYSFGSEAEARVVVGQLAPTLSAGQIDALFLPDRATAPKFAAMLQEAGVPLEKVQLIGSADWNGDSAIARAPALTGAIFPAVDDNGLATIAPSYRQKFGAAPHPFASLAYTAVILANNSALSSGSPPYDRALLTSAAGFKGLDGEFRFTSDGRSQYALVVKQLTAQGPQVVETAKIPR